MTSADWTANRDYVSISLAQRAAAGGPIWLLGRVVLGGLFLISGAGKLMAIDQFAAMLVQNGIPDHIAPALAWLGAGVETVGGLFIVLGLATNWASLFMIAFTIVAAFIAHRFWEAPARPAHAADRALREEHDDRRRVLPALRRGRRSLFDRSLAPLPLIRNCRMTAG
jgi:uncharacterized membrane protein YphA (DoxX/SURF4 family)